jgi:hypothetical protein
LQLPSNPKIIIGGQTKFCGSGTIIETTCTENGFTSIVLTSASVIPDLENSGAAEVSKPVYIGPFKF